MKLKELAELLGKDVFEVSKMLKEQKEITIKLSDSDAKPQKDELKIIKI